MTTEREGNNHYTDEVIALARELFVAHCDRMNWNGRDSLEALPWIDTADIALVAAEAFLLAASARPTGIKLREQP